jgi:hypothetical protein
MVYRFQYWVSFLLLGGYKLKFIAKPNASQRTKNRLREHGPDFHIAQSAMSVSALNDAEGLLMESDDGWCGWIPADEISVYYEDSACFGGFGQEISR